MELPDRNRRGMRFTDYRVGESGFARVYEVTIVRMRQRHGFPDSLQPEPSQESDAQFDEINRMFAEFCKRVSHFLVFGAR